MLGLGCIMAIMFYVHFHGHGHAYVFFFLFFLVWVELCELALNNSAYTAGDGWVRNSIHIFFFQLFFLFAICVKWEVRGSIFLPVE